MAFFTQSLTIFFSFLFVLIIVLTPLSSYMAPILGLVITISVIFIILMRRSKRHEELFMGSNREVFTVITAVMLAIFLTGALDSQLYFLLYFLIFGIVFLYNPATVFVLILGILVVFFESISEGSLATSLVKLGSLVFLSPIAYFFGREFQKKQRLEDNILEKTDRILKDTEALRKHGQSEDIDEIEDIFETTEDLRKEAMKD